MSNNAHELSNRLLNALDNNYNVVDMHTVNEIISILERFNITKELLEATRLGKHVNELRRKSSDPTLARRAKVLVKRWRDLVIPSVASPGHAGSNRSSAERAVRRLGGTPLTSPALARQVVSPAVASPRPPSRPAWGGYESDSQDVILVDDEPAPLPAPPVKRPLSPEPLHDDKKAKRDKKPKKRRGHSRAGTESLSSASEPVPLVPGVPLVPSMPSMPGVPHVPGALWATRNGHERRRNGARQDALDSYTKLVHKLPPAGAKKVKTTAELLEEIQSRGSKAVTSPASPRSPASPDVMLIEPDVCPIKVDSPLRNGGTSPVTSRAPSPPPPPRSPLEEPGEEWECTCGEEEDDTCPGAVPHRVTPRHVAALHHAYRAGVNGTRAPPLPHRFAVRPAVDPERPGLFASVVPLYSYSDYADDYCVKNLWRVPLCAHLPWTDFAPPPPALPPPPSPPPIRPYPLDDPPEDTKSDSEDVVKTEPEVKMEVDDAPETTDRPEIDDRPVIDLPKVEDDRPPDDVPLKEEDRPELDDRPDADERLKPEPEPNGPTSECQTEKLFASSPHSHRTVERTKEERPVEMEEDDVVGGRALVAACCAALRAAPHGYAALLPAPLLSRAALTDDARLVDALAADGERDALGRPLRSSRFAEWHEAATIGDLVALPYVVID